MLRGDDIARRLGLPHGRASEDCATRLCDRKLSVAPLLEPLCESRLVTDTGRAEIPRVLRSFRAAVRGLDDLLDRSHEEPDGKRATWRDFGIATTAATAIALWERALEHASAGVARHTVAIESEAMLAAAELEERACASAQRGAMARLRELCELELLIRDKEIAYWRLIAGLIEAHWQGPQAMLRDTRRRLLHAGDVWQRLDDARDFEEDLARRRISSAMIDLLRWRGWDPEKPLLWHAAIDSLQDTDGEAVRARLEERLRSLETEADRAHRAIRQPERRTSVPSTSCKQY